MQITKSEILDDLQENQEFIERRLRHQPKLRNPMDEESYSFFQIMQEKTERPVIGHPYQAKVRPGIYDLHYGFDANKPPNPVSLSSDKTYVLRSESTEKVRSAIKDFYEHQEETKDLGLMNKYGILLHGEPGSGKSSLIRTLISEAVENERVVFLAQSLYRLHESLQSFRALEPDRDLIVVLEDIDEMVRSYGAQYFLEMLDGSASVNNVLFLASTNDYETMPAKIKRPGRFDKKIHVPNPDAQLRLEYLEKIIPDHKEDHRVIVEATEGFSFADLRETIVSTYSYAQPLSESIAEVRQHREESKHSNKAWGSSSEVCPDLPK